MEKEIFGKRIEPYGHYGNLRFDYLQNHQEGLLLQLICDDILEEHLKDVDVRATAQVDEIIQHMAKADHCDEALKKAKPMDWVGLMNNYKSCAEEIVLPQLIYG